MAVKTHPRIDDIKKILKNFGSGKKAAMLQRFFKTGPGEYAEGDIFLGISVPVIRKFANKYRDIPVKGVTGLLRSGIHEERLLALLILILKYRASGAAGKKNIYEIYLANTKYVNNWDLVDVTAKHIIGDYLYDKDRSVLYRLARSSSLWERRISILSTFYFIEKRDFKDTLKIAAILLSDGHDLIHKAVGWMLREVGKRDLGTEERFLRKCSGIMPRTMLRYAIEKFPEDKRMRYLRPS